MTERAVLLCGPLAESPLVRIVLGSSVDTRPVRAADLTDEDGAGMAVSMVAGGGRLARLSAPLAARLAHYARARGLEARPVRLVGDITPVLGYFYPRSKPIVPWDDALERALAEEIMDWFGQVAPEQLAARLGPMGVRAASRLRAEVALPSTLRRPADPQAIAVLAHRQPYAHFFAVEEYDLTARRFDGDAGPVMTRAVFVSGDAVVVLPYDPVRDRVLLIEQFRAGPFGRGDPTPWQLEAIAGRIDPGETPEEAGRREAEEEANLTLGTFWPVADYYPSPGAKTEFIYSFVARADLPDGVAGVHGVADEAEDIKGHVLTFDQLMHLVATGEVCNAPVIILALWLQRERAALRAAVTG